MFGSSIRKQYQPLDKQTTVKPEPSHSRVGFSDNCSVGEKEATVLHKNPLIPSSGQILRAAPDESTVPSNPCQAPVLTGDYHVLRGTLVRQRDAIRRARSDLGLTLNRLGDHHVRNGQYEEAMDAYVEALHEKRSAYMTGEGPLEKSSVETSCEMSIAPQEHTVVTADTAASSLLSGISGSSSYLSSSQAALSMSVDPEEHARELGEIVLTLSSIGNVHSLRGEHAEAMRYYTEVTSLRHAASSSRSPAVARVSGDDSVVSSEWSGNSLKGGIGSGLWREEDNSTIFSDLNEDVKALDDLFQSISFRNKGASSVDDITRLGTEERRRENSIQNPSRTKRSVLEGKHEQHNRGSRRNKTREYREPQQHCKTSNSTTNSLTTEDTPASVDQLSRAITIYRSILDSYTGKKLREHEEKYMHFIDRITKLRARKQDAEENPGEQKQPDQGKSLIEEELHLALGVYDQILWLQCHDSSPSPDDRSTDEAQHHRLRAYGIRASTLIAMGSIHYSLGNVSKELRMYEKALVVYTEGFGPAHVYVAGTCKNIGMVLSEQCKFDSAMDRFRQARKIYSRIAAGDGENVCGKIGADLASTLLCMGKVQSQRGEVDEVLDIYGEALHIYRSIAEREEEEGISGSSSVVMAMLNVISTLKLIGTVYAKSGHLDKAMECFQEAMCISRSSDGRASGAIVAAILTRIAGILCKQSQYDDALSSYREAYDLFVREVGTVDHPDIAAILHCIGCIQHKRGQYDEAVENYQRAVHSYRTSVGLDCPNAATSLVCMGSIHFRKRSLDSALSYYAEALRLLKKSHGPYHPDVAPTLKSIGMVYAKRGEYDEAMECFQEVLLLKSAVMGQVHPDIASAYKNIGNVHFKKGEYGTAERQYRQALAIYRKTMGEDHSDTQATVSSIDHIRRKMREVDVGEGREPTETRSRGISRTRSVRQSRNVQY